MNKKQLMEKILIFKEMMKFFEFTSDKYNDNKDQKLTRLEGILTDCIIKKEAKASFLDLTREKMSEDSEFGCRERMVYFNESNNIKLICIGAIFLIKVIVNGVDMDRALQECVAYRNKCGFWISFWLTARREAARAQTAFDTAQNICPAAASKHRGRLPQR